MVFRFVLSKLKGTHILWSNMKKISSPYSSNSTGTENNFILFSFPTLYATKYLELGVYQFEGVKYQWLIERSEILCERSQFFARVI